MHIRDSFHSRCTFRNVLGVANELEDLLDRGIDRHSGVDLGYDSASLTVPKRIGRLQLEREFQASAARSDACRPRVKGVR